MAKDNLEKYLTRIQAAEEHRRPYETMWARFYERWRSHADALIDPETGKAADRSNIFVPETYAQVETVLPRLIETLFAARPYVAVKGRTADDLAKAKKNEILLNWQMNERMSFQNIFHRGLKGACIYGTAVAYTGWKLEQRSVVRKEMVPVTESDASGEEVPVLDEYGLPITEYRPIRSNEIIYDDPEVKFIDLGLFFIDPAAEDIEDARYCGHAEFLTKAQLKEKEALGLYKIDWKKLAKTSNEVNRFRNERLSEVGLPTVADIDDADGFYEVIHYWEDDRHGVIINRALLAADTENPFWHKRKPYRKGVYSLVPGEFYGLGIPEMLWDLQDELNTERNMRIDYRAFLLRRMFKVRRGAAISRKQLKWRQGGIIEVEDKDDVTEMGVGDSAGSSFTSESTIKRDMQDTTGGHDVVMGLSSSGETATTTMTKDSNAAMRFKLIISSLEKDLLVPIARQMLQLNQQFLSGEKVLRVTQMGKDQFEVVNEEEIQGEFDLIAAGSSVEPMANKEAAKQRAVDLYGILGNDPLISQFPAKRRALLEVVLDVFDIKNKDEILPSDEELGMMQDRVSGYAHSHKTSLAETDIL